VTHIFDDTINHGVTTTKYDDIILNIVTSSFPVRLLVQVGKCGM